nr:chromatin remodeling protein SHL isoform X2 [Aegilops tauschii subsp. strangulata]XP_040253981.1 chromatin remodeling protein SHL isoform X2 [Aegilops tauschii subsp. strangulata]
MNRKLERSQEDLNLVNKRFEQSQAGDCVLMRSADTSKPPYVAKVESIEAAGSRGTNVRVRVRWYYRPEESIGGRRPFHGSKEVFLSDHYDVQSADTIEGKCNVHSFRSYTKLDSVNAEDFFCRFDYKSASGSFVPDRIAVFCKCEMPYNPDDLMIQCEECSDWFHPSCIGMTIKEAKKREHFFCQSCTAENGKTTENFHEATGQSEEKERCYGSDACFGPVVDPFKRERSMHVPTCILKAW